jgi:SAM-dependent methyltransferase
LTRVRGSRRPGAAPAEPSRSSFLEAQHRFFAEADAGHFFWQTRNPYFARTERELLAGFPAGPGQAVLELGCGEGGNLVNLFATRAARPRLVVGAELFEQKLAFAARQQVPGRLVGADALALPFQASAFDAILCRDVLHHLEQPETAVAELRRVSRPGGAVWIVEPNGRNPLIRLLALLRPHERGQLRNSAGSMRHLVAEQFPSVEIEMRQPFPLHRLLLHYRFGLPRLGASPSFAAAMAAVDRVCRAVCPPSRWAYIVVRAGGGPVTGSPGSGAAGPARPAGP